MFAFMPFQFEEVVEGFCHVGSLVPGVAFEPNLIGFAPVLFTLSVGLEALFALLNII